MKIHLKNLKKLVRTKIFDFSPILGLLINVAVVFPALSQTPLNSSIPEERNLYNTLTGSNQTDSILDVTNPMELMNRIRRATAMDDATSPSDAIDEAIRAFEEKD